MARFIGAEDVEIESKYGTVVTYEVTAVNRKVAEKRAKVQSAVRFPAKAGASRVVGSRETGHGALSSYEVEVFLMTEDMVEKLGVDRALDGLQELGILD